MGPAVRSILYVSQRLPWPKDSGGNIRSYHTLKALGERFEVSLIASAPATVAEEGRSRLAPFCSSIEVVDDPKSPRAISKAASFLTSLARGIPAFVQHNWNRSIAERVRSALRSRRFDLVHLNHLDTYPYVATETEARYSIDTHNIVHDYYARRAAAAADPLSRAAFSLESRRLAGYELRAFRGARAVLTCSDQESEIVRALDPELPVRVVPNGVDTDYFAPPPGDLFDNPPELLFLGDMAYPPNDDAVAEFAEVVLPRLVRRIDGVRLTVVGRDPSRRLRRLCEERSEVRATGFVDDVREYMRRAKVFVVPLRYGSGTRLKVLAAFSMGIPTVSTALGVEGLGCRAGRDFLLADEPAAMAEAVGRLLQEPDLHRRISANCRRTARELYDWRGIERQLGSAYQELGNAA